MTGHERRVMRAFDEACVILLRATSDPVALARADMEEQQRIPAYPRTGELGWDDHVCAATDCRERFVPTATHYQRYCSTNCQQRDYYREHEGATRPRGRWSRERQAAVLATVAARAEAVA